MGVILRVMPLFGLPIILFTFDNKTKQNQGLISNLDIVNNNKGTPKRRSFVCLICVCVLPLNCDFCYIIVTYLAN